MEDQRFTNVVQGLQSGYYTPPQQEKLVTPVNMSEATRITSVTDLVQYKAGVVVRLPDFGEGQPFIARLGRPSMLALAKSGKIPNSLLAAASDLFQKGKAKDSASADENVLGDMYDICEIICKAALLEPTYEEIVNAGIALTDEQVMQIFNYTQVGVTGLDSFREE